MSWVINNNQLINIKINRKNSNYYICTITNSEDSSDYIKIENSKTNVIIDRTALWQYRNINLIKKWDVYTWKMSAYIIDDDNNKKEISTWIIKNLTLWERKIDLSWDFTNNITWDIIGLDLWFSFNKIDEVILDKPNDAIDLQQVITSIMMWWQGGGQMLDNNWE
jgi:hypothetical protein